MIENVYMLGLGEFDSLNKWDDSRVPNMMRLFFLFATLVVLVVMMNLLIAEVGKAYEEVIETQDQAKDYERANLIYQVERHLRHEQRDQLCKPNQYLIKASLDGMRDENTSEQEESEEK